MMASVRYTVSITIVCSTVIVLVCIVWSVNGLVNDVHCNPAQVRRESRQGKSCTENRISVIKTEFPEMKTESL